MTPPPAVRHPLAGSTEQHRFRQGNYSWNNRQALSSKTSWEDQPQNGGSKFGTLDQNIGMSSLRDEPSFIPQGYTRPVTKYIDANGVQHRVIKRTLSPNRRSFTEGLNVNDNSGHYSGQGLRAASSQKNLHHNYSSPGYSLGKDASGPVDSSPKHGFASLNFLTQTVDYLGSSKQPAAGSEQWKDISGSHIIVKDDLRHWQQQHQEQLLHQHLETQVFW